MIKNTYSVALAALLVGSISLSAASVAAGTSDDWRVNGSITGTPHDLSGTTSGAVGADDNGELCVYCHTPHASNASFSGAPLWNKSTIVTTSFQMYGAAAAQDAGATIGGSVLPTIPESPSLACLSCHDGVSAIDSIVNAPGSGSGTLAAGTATKNLTDMTLVNANTLIGTDLTNDHPVSVIYVEDRASLKPKATVLTNWVGVTDIQGLLRGADDRVECGSCHDPHNGYATDQDGPQVNYLRHTNTASALCLGCHDK